MSKSILINGGCGYIGACLSEYLLNFGYHVVSVDLNLFNKPDQGCKNNIKIDYSNLSKEFINSFDIVIHLAGHSSVKSCELDPVGSLKNNCINFFHLVNSLRKDKKFIYISSASVYGQSGEYRVKEDDNLPIPLKEYDRQKQIIDYFMESITHINWFGLRLATINGYSKNPRNRLMINSMVKSAKLNNQVTVINGDSYRGILGLEDFCQAVKAIVEQDKTSGFYNLSSFNMKIKNIGREVANILKCNYQETDGEDTYSFCLDITKFQNIFNFQFKNTIESIVNDCLKNDFSKDRF